MNSLDILIQNYLVSTRTPFLSDFMYVLTILFDWSLYFWLIIITTTLIVFLSHGLRKSILFISTLSFATIVVYFLKEILNVSRPTESVINTFGKSFPSYHATISTVFFLMLMYVFRYNFSGLSRKIFDSICIALIVLVAFSRMYLGVHWFSDVVSGVILGVIIVVSFTFIFKKIVIILQRRNMLK